MRVSNLRLLHITKSIEGVIEAQNNYQRAALVGEDMLALEELATVVIIAASLVPVNELKEFIDSLENKRAA